MNQQYKVTGEDMNNFANDTFSKYVLESQQTIERITHFLKGEVLQTEAIEDNGQRIMIPVWKQVYEPLMNKDGVNFVIQILTLVLDKTIASSNLTETKANLMARNSMNGLAYVFYGNLHNENTFGFKDHIQMEALLDYLNNIILAQTSRAINMATLKQLQTNHSVVEQRSYSGNTRETNSGYSQEPQYVGI